MGEVRHLGEHREYADSDPRLGRRITRQHGIAEFVRDTASCGYNEQRQPRSEP